MKQCTRAITTGCDDTDLIPVLLYMRHTPRLVCGPCRAFMAERGIAFEVVEQRAEDRPFSRPAWLAYLTARDETGRAA